MRKIIAALLFLNLLFSSHAFAKPGDVAGHIYSTDILAYVNSKPVQSYNIGGKTAVIVEDLDSYGFEYWYDGEGRILTINSKQNAVYGVYEIERDVPGKIAGNVYETDIKVIFNAQEIKGYNIGGRTAVCIEDLGTVESDSPNLDYGYSKYLCNFKWDSDKRNVYLNSFGAKARAMKDYLPPKVFFQKRDNTISFKFDQMNEVYSVGSANYSDEFLNDTYKLKPILHNGEKIGTMYIDWKGRVHSDIDERKVYKIVKDLPDVLSFEEAVSYIEENFDIIDTCENEKAKYFLAEKEGEQWRFLLYAQKTKGLVVELADSEAIFKDDAKGNTYLSWHGAGTPGSGIVEMMWYFMEAEEVDFDEWKKHSRDEVEMHFKKVYTITDEFSNDAFTALLDRSKRKLIIVDGNAECAVVEDIPYYDENSTLKFQFIEDDVLLINVSPFGTMRDRNSVDIHIQMKHLEFKPLI